MNDSIKQLIAGAMLTLVGAIVGGAMVMMVGTTATVKNEELKVKNSKPSAISGQLPVTSGQGSVFSGQRVIPGVQPSSVAKGQAGTAKMPISYNQFQKVQEQPEVKKAREEFMEAQRRYSEAVKKAMGPTGAGNQSSVISNQLPVKGK
jgi:hypothetical protein